MKKFSILAICIFAVYLIPIAAGLCCLDYKLHYQKTVCDTSTSPDGTYELTLLAVGEPEFPFGSASGRLVLRRGTETCSQVDFELANDGASIRSNCWTVIWNDSGAEVILSGEEQEDEQIILFFDGTVQRQHLMAEPETTAEPTVAQIQELEIHVTENRENELVFSVSAEEFIDSYNRFYEQDFGRTYLFPLSQWLCLTYDTSIHSDHETNCFLFSEDETVSTMPTITIYAPTNRDCIQQITVDYDEHAYTEQSHNKYERMCCYTLKVFFPDLSYETLRELYAQVHAMGNQEALPVEQGYGKGAIPRVLYYRNGIGVYPYFAVGDWAHLCVIPVTQASVEAFAEQGVVIYNIP